MSTKRIAAMALAACLSAAAAGDDHGAKWQPLFNGSDMTGWVSSGAKDAWGVRDGEIVTMKPGRGGWLRTDRMFRDFDLELEFWLPENGNSGVGLRGTSNGDPAFTGFEIQILDTAGQEPDVRNAGGIYEAIPADAMAITAAGQWNHYRIRVIGDRVSAWLNGTRVHDDERLDERGFYRDPSQPLPLSSRATTGYIAVQDHGHGFRFRNIKIKDLSPDPEPAGMVSLMDMDQWFTNGGGTWTMQNGELVGRDGPGHLFTHKTYRNFELRGLVHVNERGNGGIYFRARPNPSSVWPIGYEAQIDNHDPKNFTGCLYNLAWPVVQGRPFSRDNAWFDYRIRVEGDRIQTWINGRPMIDAIRDKHDDGHLALQTHHQGNELRFRDLRILELD